MEDEYEFIAPPDRPIEDLVLDYPYIAYLAEKTATGEYKNEAFAVSKEARDLIVAETEWVLDSKPIRWSKETREAVGLGQKPCPLCADRGTYTKRVKGTTTGITPLWTFPCDCRDFKRFFPRLVAATPVAYRDFRLSTLEPLPASQSKVPVEAQRGWLALMRASSDKSSLFVWPPKTSKTVYSSALFANALQEWVIQTRNMSCPPEACWFVSAYDLLKQAHEYIMQREKTYTDEAGNVKHCHAKEPVVTVDKIRAAVKAGLRPRLFIEELDKVPTVTEFRGSTIFELIKEVDAQAGQIVVTSNLPVDDLGHMYAIRDGGALLRRFSEDNATGDGLLYDFFLPQASASKPSSV